MCAASQQVDVEAASSVTTGAASEVVDLTEDSELADSPYHISCL